MTERADLEPASHWVDERPLPPPAPMASPLGGPWRIFAARFARHRLAVISAGLLLLLYASLPFAELIAPYGPNERHIGHIHAPPQPVRLLHEGWPGLPFVYATTKRVDLTSFRRIYTPDRTRPQPLRLMCKGSPYRLMGLVPWDRHLLCAPEGSTLFLLGTDRLGRDIFSRIVHGARISLTIGLAGIALSMVLGVTIGGLAGYFGGVVDAGVQRVTEILRSLPELPLWMALAAAIPATWPPIMTFFAMTLILGLLDWPGLARAVRGRFLALREEDFVIAARLMGASRRRIIFGHMAPHMTSHLIASASLSVPGMILGETALSFLGLGLRPPIVSWGVMLTEAQNLGAVELYPWLLLPVVPVMLTVLAFNFLGDGLRDAADPHSLPGGLPGGPRA